MKPEEFSISKKVKAALEDPDAGFLLIDKPSGEPSLRTVTVLRGVTGIRRIGFAGTLDPLASGLLVVGVGKATALLDWWHFFPKTYEATMRLGVRSDTYDYTGQITEVSERKPAHEELRSALESFIGFSRQIPPMYSARKVEGKKLYKLARRGIEIEREPRAVTIHSIELQSYEYPDATFAVTCSSGTYVRSLINDAGQRLATGAVMSALRRTAIGPYSIGAAVHVSGLTPGTWRGHRIGFNKFREAVTMTIFPKV